MTEVPMTQEAVLDRQALLYAALAKAQGAWKNPDRNRTVNVRSDKGNYSFDYATLDNIIETVRQALSANGLSIVQMLERDETGATVMTTRLLHAGGGMIKNEMPVSLPMPDERGRPPKIQELGSVITYARRYAICAMLNIAAEEDDDGNGGEAETKKRGDTKKKEEERKPDESAGTRESFKKVRDLILAAKDGVAIAEVMLTNKEALLKIKGTSEAGYAQLIKLGEDRALEFKQ